MTPEQRDKIMERFTAMWPTPKLTDPQFALWSDRLGALDLDVAHKVIATLEKTCKRRPALAEMWEAVALAQTSGGEGATLQVKSSYWAMAWHVSERTGSNGESRVSPVRRTLDELREWVTLARGDWGSDVRFQLDIWRRDVTGPHTFADVSLVDEGLIVGASDRREWIQDALVSMAAAHTAPRQPYRDEESF